MRIKEVEIGSRPCRRVLLAALVWLCGACDPDAGVTVGAALAEDLQALLESGLDEVKAPGLAVSVVLPDGRSWHGAVGLAAKEPEVAMQADDLFRVGSVTKMFNAAVCMQLAEEGVLSLDDPVDDWVPGFDLGSEVTIRRLLNHTTGIFNYTDDAAFLSQPPATPAEVINFSLDHGAVFEPGDSWSYSNTGFYLSGLVIEAADGRAFHESIRARLLEPAGLMATYLEPQEQLDQERVDGHVVGGDVAESAPFFDMSWAWAAGGMVSNTRDLCDWGRQLFFPGSETEALLTTASRTAMLEPPLLPDGSEGGYGLGVRLGSRGGRDVIGHTGSTMGFKGELFVDRETGACVALQTNDFLSEPVPLAHEIWQRLAEELPQP